MTISSVSLNGVHDRYTRKRVKRYAGWKIQRDKKLPFRWRAYHRTTGHKIDCQKFDVCTLAFDMELYKVKAVKPVCWGC